MIVFVLISLVMIPLLYLFVGLQIISLGDCVRSDFTQEFRMILDLSRYREYPEFLFSILLLAAMTVVSFLWNMLFSRAAKERRKIRHLTLEEKKDSSRLSGIHEAKKGTTRIEFDREGNNLGDNTVLGAIDMIFDMPKRLWNFVISGLRISDVHRMNTIQTWDIGDRQTHHRGGPPIITRRRRIWVDAGDFHSLILGATRAGKTFLVILITIILVAMGGESLIVMDVKGELFRWTGGFLKKHGYDIWNADFIDPKKSLRWNPFGIIIRKHREAYEENLKLMELPENRRILSEIATNRILIRDLKDKLDAEAADQEDISSRIDILDSENAELEKLLPEPDYSEAQELAADIAVRLCSEESSRDPFWPDSASEVLEGYINLLLEERIPDGKGGYDFLPDEMINMRSIKALHDRGKTSIDPKKNDGCRTVLEYYLTHYRKLTDMSVTKLGEFSVMPDNTRGSISSVLSNKIRYFLANEDILRMTSVSDFDLKQLGERKTALFISVHDEKGTYHTLPSILISQIYEELIKSARKKNQGRLKVPVYVIWDEFANGAPWKNIVNALTASLSRGVRFMLAIQDFSQLEDKYGKLAKTIKSNCQNVYYLLAGENATLEEVSKMCGTKIRWDVNRKDKVKEPVLSTDALRKLSFGQAVIIRQRKNPFITWLKRFDRYGFILPQTQELEERALPKTPVFDIKEEFERRKKQDENHQKNFEIEAAVRSKEQQMKPEEMTVKETEGGVKGLIG